MAKDALDFAVFIFFLSIFTVCMEYLTRDIDLDVGGCIDKFIEEVLDTEGIPEAEDE